MSLILTNGTIEASAEAIQGHAYRLIDKESDYVGNYYLYTSEGMFNIATGCGRGKRADMADYQDMGKIEIKL